MEVRCRQRYGWAVKLSVALWYKLNVHSECRHFHNGVNFLPHTFGLATDPHRLPGSAPRQPHPDPSGRPRQGSRGPRQRPLPHRGRSPEPESRRKCGQATRGFTHTSPTRHPFIPHLPHNHCEYLNLPHLSTPGLERPHQVSGRPGQAQGRGGTVKKQQSASGRL